MALVENTARVQVGNGASVERLVCHPRLPLVAGLDSQRPAVHVWDCGSGEPRELATIGADTAAYEADAWQRTLRTPAASWHPHQPMLVVTGKSGLQQWAPAGVSMLDGLPTDAAYRYVAFSPDGRTVWASPSSGGEGAAGYSSDAVDTASGRLRTGPTWDTGVATHPAGGLVSTLCSDQGATLGLFARVDQVSTPAAIRVLRRALILDADGYECPIFSPDGRHIAIRGNAYENTIEVFELPSLHRVLATTLGEPNPGYPYPPEWLEQMRSWSRHNIAFATQPGALLVGTPAGTVVEVDVDTRQAVEHDVLGGSPVRALAVVATGQLVVASSAGELVLLSLPGDHTPTDAVDGVPAGNRVETFLDGTSEIPEDGDLYTHLVMTDGTTTWTPDDLATTTTAAATDPTWLQLQAFVNAARDQES